MKHIKDKSIFLLILLIISGMEACNMDQHITPDIPVLSQEEEAFVINATYINLIGKEYALLAEGRSSNGLILAYAQRLSAEHTAAGTVIRAMANDFGIYAPDHLTAEQQLEKDRLSDSEGVTFDSLYIQRNIENHLWSKEVMEEMINNNGVEELVQYAGQQLMQVNERLNDALVIQSELP